MSTPDPQADLRKAAVNRLNAKLNFKRYLGVWFITSIILVAVWAFSDRGFFWPVFPIFFMGVAAFWIGFAAYGPRDTAPTEADIQNEIRKMQ